MKTIYLADDDEDDRMLIRDAIERVIDNVEVIEVEDGEKLLTLITANGTCLDSTLILMDMNMPRKNGLETLTFLKSNPKYEHIPVLMMSTTSNHQMIEQAYKHGIDGYMVKPVSEDEFTSLAESIDTHFPVLRPIYKHNSKVHAVRGWNAARWNNDVKNLPNFWWKTVTYSKKR